MAGLVGLWGLRGLRFCLIPRRRRRTRRLAHNTVKKEVAAPEHRISADGLSDLFLTEEEEISGTNFLEIFNQESALLKAKVPGGGPSDHFLVPADHAIAKSADIIGWVLMLQGLGWTLKGDLSPYHFKYTRLGTLKALATRMEYLERFSPDDDNLDMNASADIIQYAIFGGGEMPSNYHHLLRLLRKYKARYQVFILQHPALMNEEGGMELFEVMFFGLRQLRLTNEAKYRKVISRMPFCSIGKSHWKLRCQANKHLTRMLAHQFKGKKKQSGVPSGRGGQGGGRGGRGGGRGGTLAPAPGTPFSVSAGRGTGRGQKLVSVPYGRGRGRGVPPASASGPQASVTVPRSVNRQMTNSTSTIASGSNAPPKKRPRTSGVGAVGSSTLTNIPAVNASPHTVVVNTPLIPAMAPLQSQINQLGPDYKSNGSGLLKLHRNGKQHFGDYSVAWINAKKQKGRKIKKKAVVLFRYHQMMHILGFSFPCVIPKLQKALHDVREYKGIVRPKYSMRELLQKSSGKNF